MTYYWQHNRNLSRDGNYRFGRNHHEFLYVVRAGTGNWLRKLIEIVGNAKRRRLQRELMLRGIRYDEATGTWSSGALDRQHRSR